MTVIIQATYLIAAILFIIGLRRMSSPVTARSGIVWAGWGMIIAVVVTLLQPGMQNYLLILTAIALGSAIAWYSGKRVAMTAMPQVIAIYNGVGGGAAAGIAAIELLGHGLSNEVAFLAIVGALIGTVAFSGSVIAFAKLQGWMQRSNFIPKPQLINIGLAIITVVAGALLWLMPHSLGLFILFFVIATILGIALTMPIGGANMPIVISLLNAFTGLAVGIEGYVINNPAMIVAGTVVGAAGTLLTQLMAKAMNRSIASVLFSSAGQGGDQTAATQGEMKALESNDAAAMMAYAKQVIIVPGYGLAVAQAQHKIWDMAKRLEERGVTVKFAIHPVAGRMPGHMNVLLAEASVPYDKIYDLDDINDEFANTDVVLVIGANDVVNPAARDQADSPIYGMPILNVDYAKNVLVVKRGKGAGFSGVENSLFTMDNTHMVFGDGQKVIGEIIQALGEF